MKQRVEGCFPHLPLDLILRSNHAEIFYFPSKAEATHSVERENLLNWYMTVITILNNNHGCMIWTKNIHMNILTDTAILI